MWLGLLYLSAGETDACDGDAAVLLLAWEEGRLRPLTVGVPLDAVSQIAGLLREAAQTAPVLAPRCDACDTPLELPLH
jgi:hypothetical protein